MSNGLPLKLLQVLAGVGLQLGLVAAIIYASKALEALLGEGFWPLLLGGLALLWLSVGWYYPYVALGAALCVVAALGGLVWLYSHP